MTGSSTGNFGTSGFVFGGTVGANYQVGSLVFGVEADGDWADASGFGTFTASALCAGGCLTTSSWLSTVRGRAGYAFDRFLVYGTGGAAFGNVRANFSNDPRQQRDRSRLDGRRRRRGRVCPKLERQRRNTFSSTSPTGHAPQIAPSPMQAEHP